ncbi:zinc-ribbon domain-containing protein [Falsiphaeobacter marinintestinus]|uniref:zinc-ribbon domain-containing protein n=1 Tax=Falsiphaeobacter marinintestinus TaxID=1492905 RepID=UPI0011B6425F|nr:zinc-ribbon domain-containing protein [Phaeobacter marinintestinus]
MRLTCPNCGAQYEVPEGVVPTEGRDVQCSNCGNTWFQPHPDHPQEQPEPESEVESEPDFTPVPDPSEPEPETAPEPEPEPEPRQPDLADPAPNPVGERQELDNSVSSILREEAEREAQLRAEENSAIETQADLGLENFPGDEAAIRAKQARDRMAMMRGEPTEPTDPGSRRSLLPDIEEINSTLRTQNEPSKTGNTALADVVAPRKKSGFSRGFALALIIVALLVAIYANAPLISEKVPQVNSILNAYVGVIDQARNWLDDLIGSAIPR